MNNPESGEQVADSYEVAEPPIDSEDQAESETPIPDCIQFFKQGLHDELLAAAVSPSDEFHAGLATRDIHAWISAQGCCNWFMHEEAISQLLREIRRLKSKKEYIVAERKDCQIEVIVSPDLLDAWIRITPAFGGEPLTEELFMRRLEENHVCFGLDIEKIRQIADAGSCEKELIAKGIPPIPGEKAKFEELVKESEHKGVPQERSDGSVDYKNLGLFRSVSKGTPLLKRIPPTAGTPGTAINGSSVPAPAGTDRFLVPSAGAITFKDDPNILVAARVGQPFYLDNSVRVDPTLEIDTVDPSTGNVIFDGNILIRGPVEAGYTVSAGQDLTILDTVEGANLSAGRNMALLTGVYGKNKSEIRATGSLEARFLSDCSVQCNGNVEIADLISYCTVECDGSLFLGKNGGRGQAYGGRIRASKEIHAQILGSVSETATLIEVAPSRDLILSREKMKKEMDVTRSEYEIVEKNIKLLKSRPAKAEGDALRIKELMAKNLSLGKKLDELKKLMDEIQKKIEISEKGRIQAAQAHRGVALHIGSLKEIISEETTDLYLYAPVPKK
jgi:uncharacterized protein